MALIVIAMIAIMSLVLGAEQGPKADPTTTTYVPRPEWYFFFLFEVLRVIKPPELVPLATIILPNILLVLLLLLPFYDRNPERRPERRPVATTAGVLTIIAMAFLTYLGASAGSPDRDRGRGRRRVRGWTGGRGPVRLPRLPQVRRERQRRARPRADRDRRESAASGDRAVTRQPVGDHAALRRPARGEVRRARRLPRLAPGRVDECRRAPRAPERRRSRAATRRSSPRRCARCSTASRACTTA